MTLIETAAPPGLASAVRARMSDALPLIGPWLRGDRKRNLDCVPDLLSFEAYLDRLNGDRLRGPAAMLAPCSKQSRSQPWISAAIFVQSYVMF